MSHKENSFVSEGWVWEKKRRGKKNFIDQTCERICSWNICALKFRVNINEWLKKSLEESDVDIKLEKKLGVIEKKTS